MHYGKFQVLILNWLHFSLFKCFIAVTTKSTFYRVSATKMSFAWFWLHRAFFWVLKKYLKITWKLRTAMAINDNTVPHSQKCPAHPCAPFNTHSTLGAEFHIFGGFCSSVCGSLCVSVCAGFILSSSLFSIILCSTCKLFLNNFWVHAVPARQPATPSPHDAHAWPKGKWRW